MKSLVAALSLSITALATSTAAVTGDELVVYSARKEHLIKPLFDAYTRKTGIEIRYITDKAAPLLVRLKAEGDNTPADILMTVDAGNLWQAAKQGVLGPVESNTLQDNIPSHLRDPDKHWFGLSMRARTIVYSTERVKPAELDTYEGLAGPEWKGRLCLRTAKKVYNQSLVATMMARLGKEKAEQAVSGWAANLAAPPFSNDTKTMQAIAAGQCDAGIVNTYYFGRLQKKQPDIALALFWPNQEDSGVHVNVSGAGVTKHARHRDAAVKLLEWLSGPKAQAIFASLNMEYPANPGVENAPEVAAWGSFKADNVNVSTAGELQSEAVMLMDRAGYR